MQNFVTRALRINNSGLLRNFAVLMNSTVSRSISHTTVVEDSSFDEINKVSRWMRYNEQVFPPQDPSEPPRPAVIV